MPDVFSKQKRSEVMSRVRAKGNTSTEQRFLALLRESRITGWRRHYKIEGTPDFAFPKLKIAVFLDGAFWHGHPSSPLPKKNRCFWEEKIGKNKERDERVNRALKKRGWTVIRIWDFDLRKRPNVALGRVKRMITVKKKRLETQTA